MARTRCTDRVVGAILASWRYDISGISPEMRKDYEQHFAECPHCSARQKFHRSLDVTLAVLTSLAVFSSSLRWPSSSTSSRWSTWPSMSSAWISHDTYHMLVSAGIAGLCFSVIALALVLTATPVPDLPGRHRRRARQADRRASPAAIRSLRSALKAGPKRERRSRNGFAFFISIAQATPQSAPANPRLSSPSAVPASAHPAALAQYPAATHRSVAGNAEPLQPHKSTAPDWWCGRCAGRR